MIKLVAISPAGERMLHLTFSDGSFANWSAEELLAHRTVLTEPLQDPDYFARVFIEAGALAWPNGLELSAASLHRKLDQAGQLSLKAA